jgi:hypothetical protein
MHAAIDHGIGADTQSYSRTLLTGTKLHACCYTSWHWCRHTELQSEVMLPGFHNLKQEIHKQPVNCNNMSYGQDETK